MKKELDRIDIKIISALQSDGRMTNVDLANSVGISAPPCLRRVRALEKAGYLTGYHADVDSVKLGFTVTVFAMVGLHSQADKDLQAFEGLVRSWPEVRECHMLNGDIDFILKKYDKKTKIYPSLEKELLDISKHFNKKSIKEIINSLKSENLAWCKEQLNILEKKSPTSMGVATRQLDISRSLNLKDCLSMEFRICQAMMDRHDFYEGVRANLVDKDRDPKWKPITIDLLEEKLIDDHFKKLEDKELF